MDELMTLAKQLGEEEQRIKDDMAQGRAEEYAQYMHACGIIRGFQIAQGHVASLIRNREEDDE
ncbi:MAG: hypothetical protein Tp1100SUR639781_30 [Prokaryotic dsDNA virus sp.]|mgnify:FL=1|nr:MAG: hypothetical protein Tp1100SUR639781_30 [Prokaryotic dsDNA virus sp.]|tara:strand:+ start:381 stop:569 length:189 start_codon:yes stop_codon:yes gene_type:complete